MKIWRREFKGKQFKIHNFDAMFPLPLYFWVCIPAFQTYWLHLVGGLPSWVLLVRLFFLLMLIQSHRVPIIRDVRVKEHTLSMMFKWRWRLELNQRNHPTPSKNKKQNKTKIGQKAFFFLFGSVRMSWYKHLTFQSQRFWSVQATCCAMQTCEKSLTLTLFGLHNNQNIKTIQRGPTSYLRCLLIDMTTCRMKCCSTKQITWLSQ